MSFAFWRSFCRRSVESSAVSISTSTAWAPAAAAASRIRDLIFDAAVESAVILMTPAGGENGAAGMVFGDGAEDGESLFRLGEVIEPEFEEGFVGFRLVLGGF